MIWSHNQVPVRLMKVKSEDYTNNWNEDNYCIEGPKLINISTDMGQKDSQESY